MSSWRTRKPSATSSISSRQRRYGRSRLSGRASLSAPSDPANSAIRCIGSCSWRRRITVTTTQIRPVRSVLRGEHGQRIDRERAVEVVDVGRDLQHSEPPGFSPRIRHVEGDGARRRAPRAVAGLEFLARHRFQPGVGDLRALADQLHLPPDRVGLDVPEVHRQERHVDARDRPHFRFEVPALRLVGEDELERGDEQGAQQARRNDRRDQGADQRAERTRPGAGSVDARSPSASSNCAKPKS